MKYSAKYSQLVMPDDANNVGTLFGGQMISWMDLAAAKECWEYQSFCHTSDPYTYTTIGKVWLHDLSMNINDTIIPLIDDPIIYLAQKPYAICTDYPYLLK